MSDRYLLQMDDLLFVIAMVVPASLGAWCYMLAESEKAALVASRPSEPLLAETSIRARASRGMVAVKSEPRNAGTLP